jgi:putative flippase GtrA
VRLGGEIGRYVINGALSTLVHFMTLLGGLQLFELKSVGAANFIAALVGSTSAFLGNRYFVFPGSRRSAGGQLAGFAILYLAAAAFHGTFLYLWSDVYGGHYLIGFLIATAIQIVLVYLCNRTMVFN